MEENKLKPPVFVFEDPMTRGERLAALIYLPLHVAALPLLLSLLVMVWPEAGLTETSLNIFYYALGSIYMLVFLWKYFRRAYDTFLDGLARCLLTFFMAYLIDIILTYALQLIFMAFGYDIAATPNDETVMTMAEQGYNAMFAMAVFMAPLVEEPLFRGLIFGGLRKKNRILAYALSAGLFALYHVWQYAVAYADPSYLVYALNYLPVSIALAYSYEKSGSIWVPIGFHMMVNAISLYVSNIM
ncbi:MAG: CPBP family intramembrane metalloprotease [Clostridia bacterium]|nr:CPBP family intramembrane metalloprotease [Clostridia bacterium]NCC69219.1 CPBP family intramembrane metalloprotease [Clostridia bacterium]